MTAIVVVVEDFQRFDITLVGHIENVEVAFINTASIGSVVLDIYIVNVCRLPESYFYRFDRIGQIEDSDPPGTSVRTNNVGIPISNVEIVSRIDPRILSGKIGVPRVGQIDNIEAAAVFVGDIKVVTVGLQVPPAGVGALDVTRLHGMGWIG